MPEAAEAKQGGEASGGADVEQLVAKPKQAKAKQAAGKGEKAGGVATLLQNKSVSGALMQNKTMRNFLKLKRKSAIFKKESFGRGDQTVLEEFYKSTDGEHWMYSENWMSDKPIGLWQGVTTNEENRVITISLRANNLQGTLPTSLEFLSELQTLDLMENDISGQIPPNIRRCLKLVHVNLSHNRLTGTIPPTIGHLQKLTFLRLHNNLLEGEVPAGLGYCKSIRQIHLQCNHLTGSLPAKLASCETLQDLRVYNNRLGGKVPAEFWQAEEDEETGEVQDLGAPDLQIVSLSLNKDIANKKEAIEGFAEFRPDCLFSVDAVAKGGNHK